MFYMFKSSTPTETTLYILNVTDSIGCINSDTVEVNIKGDIFVPNTFTPNGDGDNDLFEIKGENIKSFELWFTIDGVKKFIILPK